MPLVRQAPCDKGRAGGAAPRVSAVESSKGIRSGARPTFPSTSAACYESESTRDRLEDAGGECDHVDLLWSATCIINGMSKNKNKPKDFGPTSGDHASDDQGLPNIPEADSEGVKELVDEGQPFEGSAVDEVEETSEPEASEVRTRQVPEDDVPPEYLEQD